MFTGGSEEFEEELEGDDEGGQLFEENFYKLDQEL